MPFPVNEKPEFTLSEAIRAFADHVEIPYAPNVPHLIRSLLTIFEKSKLNNDRQVVLDMFNMVFRHYLKYNLYMINYYDQEYTNYFFDRVKSKTKHNSCARNAITDLLKSSREENPSVLTLSSSGASKVKRPYAANNNRSHLFRMINNNACLLSEKSDANDVITEQSEFKFLITNDEDSNEESDYNSDMDDEPSKPTKSTSSTTKKSPNSQNKNAKETKKGGKTADKRLSEELQPKASKRSYETPFRDKFTLGEDSTKTTMLIMDAFTLVRDYLNKFADAAATSASGEDDNDSANDNNDDEENCLLICEWSIETISEMYEEASSSYTKLDDYIAFEKWQSMFKVIRSCPYFEIIENIFEKFLFSPLDPQDIAATIVKHSTSRSWVVAYMNYCLWKQINCSDFDMSLENHFAVLDQDCQDDSLSNRGFSRIRIFLQIMKYISDEEPDMVIGSCMSNIPIFLNLLGTSRELLNCYMSQLDVLNDYVLQFIFEYPNSEEVILRMFDILKFSQSGFQIEMLLDHIEALLDSLISICEDYNRCFTGSLVEKQSDCYRFIKNISPSFVASLLTSKDTEKNTKLKMNFVRALCSGNINNLRTTFKAELLTLFLQTKITSLPCDFTVLRNEEFETLFDTLTNCYNSEHLVELVAQIFPNLTKLRDIQSQQLALNYFISLLIAKDFCKRHLYSTIVNNFTQLRKDPICIFHNLRLLDHWSELYFRSILPEHKDYSLIYPTVMDTYFNVVKRISYLEKDHEDYQKYHLLYPKVLRLILKYFGRFSGLKHCNNQIASNFVITCFKNCSTISNGGRGYLQTTFLLELLKTITIDHDQEQMRNVSDWFVKALQTHFVTNKIGLYIIPQIENELKLLEFFKENEFFFIIFEYFSKRQTLRWFHHVIKSLLSASISDLQSSRSLHCDFVNYGVVLFEMFSNGEYFSKSFLRLIDHMQDFKTFSRAEQATMLEEVYRVFTRYGAEIYHQWKAEFFRNHFSQCRLLISGKLANADEILADIEQWS